MHSNNGRPATPQAYFHSISGRYDVFNRVLSLGSDVRWRAKVLKNIHVGGLTQIVDVGAGTAISAKVLRKMAPSPVRYVGVELNQSMCRIAKRELARFRSSGCWSIVQASAESLPVKTSSADVALLFFALDDFIDPSAALREVFRVLRPGGLLLIMQLGLPESGVMRHVWRCLLVVLRFVVGIAKMRPLAHLCLEILKYAGIDYTLGRCRHAGFEPRTSSSLAAGLVHACVMVKPNATGQ